ncbi:MAG: aldo/keto reductase [Acidobacteria bacterium]|jgi:predicted aldo/keto reductase-like oxidoreductase|nr:aldo/keto reductase [Acidobacteriota bacterium]
MQKKKNGYNRRDFLTTVGSIAAAGLLGKAELPLGAQKAPEAEKAAEPGKKPISRVLGKTGIRVPIVSMGVMNADNPALVKRSFEMGVRHFDTAWGYQKGRNEEMVGGVIKELKARDQFVIATKVPPGRPELMDQMGDKLVEEEFLSRFDQSLARLQTDHVEILYIHNISDPKMLTRAGIVSAVDKLKKTKKATHIGFSTHRNMAECIEAAVPMGRFDVILTSINYAMADDKPLLEAMKKAAAAGIGLVAMKTQCKQAWSKESGAAGPEYHEGAVWHAALLKWALRLDFVATAIPGYTTFQQLETDWLVALNLEYTPDEAKFLASPGVQLALGGVCRQCGGCAGSCPRGVDVPALVRAHMYAADYGNFPEMRRAMEEIPAGRGLTVCADCRQCAAACVRRVQVARRLAELKAIFA